MTRAKALVCFLMCQSRTKISGKNSLFQPAPTSNNNQSVAKQKNMRNMSLSLNHVGIQLLNVSPLCQIYIEEESLVMTTL